MKKRFIFFIFFLAFGTSKAQTIRFVHISDTHIGSPNGSAEEDLRRTVADINARNDIEFVVLTGDITELGTDAELNLAKKLLDQLKVRWFIIPGNHDTGWSESGGKGFIDAFGDDKFVFDWSGIRFIGCPSGPYVRMSDGHIPRSALIWLDSILANTNADQPVIFLNHYPIDPGMDNWYDVTDRLGKVRTQAILCGHGHANRQMNFDGIPGFMGRSNLRAKADVGGYNLVDIRNDSIFYTELRPGQQYSNNWVRASLKKDKGLTINSKRPEYNINQKYSFVTPVWVSNSDANVISTPLLVDDLVIFGDQKGQVKAMAMANREMKWLINTQGPIFSTPAEHKKNIIIGSGDGTVYCFRAKDGKPIWKFPTKAAVLGSPIVEGDKVFIGGSDHSFRALDAGSGKELWAFSGLDGPVVSTPVINNDKIIFGAWDRHLYALDKKTGVLLWKWNNGSTVRNYSPASCIPVIAEGAVFIVAPDRYITSIDIETGKTLWRNNDATVRESIGISADKKWIYAKTMQDTIVAYRVSREKQSAAWKMHCGFGYEHVPSMLIEKEGLLFFGTKNGVVYCIDPLRKSIEWAYKIDNSMVNTVRPVNKNRIIISTMDGKVVLLQVHRVSRQ